MHATEAHIHAAADTLKAEHARCDEAGTLTAETVRILRESRGMRLLQAEDSQGYALPVTAFARWVRAVAQYNPSAGWVAGVVGVHPWEMALVDRRLQDEVYGRDPDTWVASPYAPSGLARAVDGGYVLNGEWQYSTGTDHCRWVVLGGLVPEADGTIANPPHYRHFFLPWGDYEIVPDSWHVMGLSGTGSKNVRVREAFVPDYRTVAHFPLCEGAYGEARAGLALYQQSFACVFSAAIASATLGIAQGALREYRAYLKTRVSASQVVGKTDPFQQEALAEVEADLAAAIAHIDSMLIETDQHIQAGGRVTQAMRLEFRRNQVRAVQRVLFAMDKLYARAGSAACWTTRPLERYWRDLRTAGTHICNTVEAVYPAWANFALETGAPIMAFH
ncbi:MAG: acyl-CoA dehydrogenase [Gammaproteobacteria bacterium]|nr:acyl-CoA dehydrogenase [Gammaproteobacteria bacterium]